jgi:2-(1,2-epoxy-1,2-dihydrophenyl)acetyl-CoA isomerase
MHPIDTMNHDATPDASPAQPALVDSLAEGVLTLTLNRPAVLNSLTAALIRKLGEALASAAQRQDVRCVVLAGAGKGFCAGQDLSDAAIAPSAGGAPNTDTGDYLRNVYKPMLTQLRRMPVPTLAVVHGVAAGAGASLALGCDFVLAGRSASFVQAFAKIGLIPDCGGTWLLAHKVGRAKAMGLAMLGDKLPAEEAERLGLIWRCVADEDLAASAQALAKRLALMPSQALVATRELINAAASSTYEESFELEAVWQGKLTRAADYLEGVAAFAAKRAPVFKDR